ncbi:MAG: DNA polymerase III subunit gamma/tau [Candidatus Competibacterales bacterium]
MSAVGFKHRVLARQWRPRRFEDLVGQEHIVKPLSHALNRQTLHPALLFTGTRGVGKTTIARIIAKALNCEVGVSASPCGRCSACVEVDAGRFLDLIEVDAASRTGVDDTRELLDNVPYAPTRGRYKVYLIDEVHMFSKSSFNALLKTLEEPPPHVVFLLATTDPQKLPVTVLSRCLQFHLKRLATPMIAERLATILDAEGIAFERQALGFIARAGDGSLRDALSLLDQAIAFGAGAVTTDDVTEMLGLIDRRKLVALLGFVVAGDVASALAQVELLDAQGVDLEGALGELIGLLQRLAVIQAWPDGVTDEDADLRPLANQLSPEDIQLYYQIALLGRRDLPLSPDVRGGFEMLLLRLLYFSPNRTPAPGRAPPSIPPPSVPSPSAVPPSSAPPERSWSAVAEPKPAPPVAPTPRVPPEVEPLHGPSASAEGAAPDADWAAIVPRLGLGGLAQQLATHSTLKGVAGGVVTLALDDGFVRTKPAEARLAAALGQYYGRDITLVIDEAPPEAVGETPARAQVNAARARQADAEAALEADPNLRALRQTFGAVVKSGTITPTEQAD